MFDSNRAEEKKILENINRVVQLLIELSYSRGSKKDALYNDSIKLLKEMRPNLLVLIDGREELLESLTKQLISQKLPHPFIFNSFGDLQRDLNHILAMASRTVEENDNKIDYTEKTSTAQQDNETICLEAAEECPEAIECAEIPDKPEVVESPETFESAKAFESPEAVESPDAAAGPDPAHCTIAAAQPAQKETGDLTPAEKIQKIIENTFSGEEVYKNYVFRSLQIDYYVPAKKLGIITNVSPLHRHKIYEYMLKKEGIKLIEISPGNKAEAANLLRQLPR